MGEIQTQKDIQLIFQTGPQEDCLLVSKMMSNMMSNSSAWWWPAPMRREPRTLVMQHVLPKAHPMQSAPRDSRTPRKKKGVQKKKREEGMEKPGRKDENLYYFKQSHNSFGERKDKIRPGVSLHLI